MTVDHDAIIVGAGFAGLYAIHKLRDQLELSVQAFEAGSDVGGTWYWNRYPGARVDIPSTHYSYSFSPEIEKEWRWSEKYAAQPELQAYFQFVAEKLDSRRSIRFGTRVVGARWDEKNKYWSVTTDDDVTLTATYLVTGVGNLNVATGPDLPGNEDFAGEIYRTNDWPRDGVELTGLRVGVIGTGSTGIQVIQELGKVAETLTVFQRTPNYITPLRNERFESARQDRLAENHVGVRAGMRDNFWGWPMPTPELSGELTAEDERRAKFEAAFEAGGQHMTATYADLISNKASNDAASEFIREKIRERVQDPKVAALLTPTDYPYMTKRPPMETDYYDIFNQANVELIDVKTDPIERMNAAGVVTGTAEYALDVLILATGFDAMTGALLNMGIVGEGGQKLEDAWAGGPTTLLGIGVPGFPNLVTITGPTSHVGLHNNVMAIEDHVDFAAELIEHSRASGASTFEPTVEAAERWQRIISGMLAATLIPTAKSWWMGDNVEGKPRAASMYAAGAQLFRTFLTNVQASGFGGFAFDGKARPIGPMLLIDPSVALMVNAMLTLGAKTFDDCETVEQMREIVEGFPALQVPGPEMEVVAKNYISGDSELSARIYVPNAESSNLRPVVVYFHGGGFVAGSLASNDNVCRELADRLDAIVIAPSYRLAPEHPFPAAANDAIAALVWASVVAPDYGGDSARLFVAGESAGGNLAAIAALHARDNNGPSIAGQILITPAIDADLDTASMRDFAWAPGLSGAVVETMRATYLQGAKDAASPLASPNRAESLVGLPRSLVITAEVDPLRDEGEFYAQSLRDSGVDARTVRLEGLVHGAPLGLSALLPRRQEIFDAVADFVTG